ncbi:hypothetical protein MMC07_007702 [Pseudocyphellaria aurata]|nr:hypothetical protein [Pseudocyphellaria aurata]
MVADSRYNTITKLRFLANKMSYETGIDLINLNEMEESRDNIGPQSAYVVPSPESPANPKTMKKLHQEGEAFVKKLSGQLTEKDDEIKRLRAEVASCVDQISKKDQRCAWLKNELASKLPAPGEAMLTKALVGKKRGKASTPILLERQASVSKATVYTQAQEAARAGAQVSPERYRSLRGEKRPGGGKSPLCG